jgi:hypothetical protein
MNYATKSPSWCRPAVGNYGAGTISTGWSTPATKKKKKKKKKIHRYFIASLIKKKKTRGQSACLRHSPFLWIFTDTVFHRFSFHKKKKKTRGQSACLRHSPFLWIFTDLILNTTNHGWIASNAVSLGHFVASFFYVSKAPLASLPNETSFIDGWLKLAEKIHFYIKIFDRDLLGNCCLINLWPLFQFY